MAKGSFYHSSLALGLPEGRVEPDQPPACLEDSIIQRLSQTVFTGVEKYEETMDQVLLTVLDVGKSVFDEVAPANKIISPPAEQDLHTLLYPSILAFRLTTVGSTPAIIPIGPGESYIILEPTFHEDPEGELETDDSLPRYSSQQITVMETFVSGSGYRVSRVLVNEKEMLCKVRSEGLRCSDIKRELGSIQKIREACLHGHAPMRVPALMGYIIHSRSRMCHWVST